MTEMTIERSMTTSLHNSRGEHQFWFIKIHRDSRAIASSPDEFVVFGICVGAFLPDLLASRFCRPGVM